MKKHINYILRYQSIILIIKQLIILLFILRKSLSSQDSRQRVWGWIHSTLYFMSHERIRNENMILFLQKPKKKKKKNILYVYFDW